MNTKRILAVSAVAALAIGIGATGKSASAQQQTPAPAARVLLNGEDLSAADETGWLGVTPEDISADRAKELKLSAARGVYLSDVEKDSPAEKAGLKSGDVITEFNGTHVEGVTQFRRLVRETPPGHSVSIVVTRDGKSQTLNATLSTMSDQFQHGQSNSAPANT